jgi:hypothetical protein
MRKLFLLKTSLSFILFIVFGFSTACSQPKQSNTPPPVLTSVFDDAEYEQILHLHEKLMSSFSPNWQEREADPELYPEYYGGVFIRDEDGKFVILVTDNAEQYKQELAKILETDDFDVETVEYSYRQMFEVINKIEDFMTNPAISDDHIFLQNFTGAFIDDMSNRVVVMLLSTDDAVINAFRKEISDSKVVIFGEGNWMDY